MSDASSDPIREANDAFYRLTVAQRDRAWRELETAEAALEGLLRWTERLGMANAVPPGMGIGALLAADHPVRVARRTLERMKARTVWPKPEVAT